jgi:Domain of unknown function (DUF4062)
MPSLSVFISSTFLDFLEVRVELKSRITKVLPVSCCIAEHLTTTSPNLHMELKTWVKDADVIILLLGMRYGSLDPASNISWTEEEIRNAQADGKRILPYRKKPSKRALETDVDEKKQSELRAFVGWLHDKVSCNIPIFADTTDLIAFVVRDLQLELHRREQYASSPFGSEEEPNTLEDREYMDRIVQFARKRSAVSSANRPDRTFTEADLVDQLNLKPNRAYQLLDSLREEGRLTCLNVKNEAKWSLTEALSKPSQP